jgi:hypothetical protein
MGQPISSTELISIANDAITILNVNATASLSAANDDELNAFLEPFLDDASNDEPIPEPIHATNALTITNDDAKRNEISLTKSVNVSKTKLSINKKPRDEQNYGRRRKLS